MIISLSDAAAFKQEVAARFPVPIHFHDGCGGQYFSMDEPMQELKEWITDYFAERNLQVRFSADGKQFFVEEIFLC